MKVSALQANYIRDLKLHDTQEEVEHNDKFSIFTYRLRPEYDFQQEAGFNSTTIDGMTGFIFCNKDGNVHNPQTINRTIKRIVSSYNAEEVIKAKRQHRDPLIITNFSCHHLRHTFCTRLCEVETNIKVVQSVMGHANIETTMDIYAEATKDKKIDSFKDLSTQYSIF